MAGGVLLARAKGSLIAIALSACGITADPTDERDDLSLITNIHDAPAWTVPFGEERWSRPPGVNVGGAIERVQHAIRRDPSTGMPSVKGGGYVAAFDGDGLRFSSGSDARLRTTRIAFGDDVAYAQHDLSWSLLGNTAQVRLAPSIIEHYETLAAGVELAWVFRERRAGDLTIDVAIDGVTTAGMSDGSIQLVDSAGTAQARIGAAMLVDANGRRWTVDAEARTGGARWRVGAEVLADAAFPVVVDPLIGPEMLVADPALGTSQRHQLNPSIAASTTGYLVVWTDYQIEETQYSRAARISSNGVLLDPAGITLAPGGPDGGPRVASNGTDFLVVWHGTGIEATRVSAAGVVLDATPFTVSASSYAVAIPAVASNGTDYLVSWASTDAIGLYASRVTAAGAVQDPNGIAIAVDGWGTQWLPAVASNGSAYLVVWGRNVGFDPRRIYAARVGFDGVVLDPQGFAVSSVEGADSLPAVTSNGSDYLVAWEDDRTSAGMDVYGSRVTASGQVLDPAGIAISTAETTQTRPRLAWNGSNYLAVWEDDRSSPSMLFYDIYGARIATDGTVLDATGVALASGRALRAPAVAANGGNYLVAWQDATDGPSDIYARRFNAVLAPIEPKAFPVALSPNAYAPAIASNGTTFFVAWEDARLFETTGVDITGTRLSGTGAVLDPAGIAISNANGAQRKPVIASNGTDYLVAWEDNRSGLGWSLADVYATRVSAAGSVVDAAGVAVCTAAGSQDMLAIASDGSDYLLAWRDYRGIANNPNIFIGRVTNGGAALDADGVLFAPTSSYFYPVVSLASNGSSYLIAADDYVRRLTTTGVPDTAPANISFARGAHSASVASNGTDYLVAWATDYNGPPLYATRVSGAGTVVDTAAIQLPATTNAEGPSVASDGASYVVAWQNDVYNTSPVDILAARVGANGAVWDVTPLPIATSSSRETNPAVAYNATSDSFAIAYEARQLVYVRLLGWSCGDGVRDGDELCDDGATTAGDGCSATCIVESGYTCSGSPSTCSDIDECTTNNGGCSANATCTNTVGSRTCACNAGYDGDGVTCTDVNECATNNGGCAANATCTNIIGSRTCACNVGYEGDGLSCSDIDECATSQGACSTNATCTNTAGSYACVCNVGYVGDGVTCSDVDECATSNGGCAGTCTNTVGSYTCACAPGYTLDANGHACNDVDECATNNSGCEQVCMNTIGSFTCACSSGFALADDDFTCTAVDDRDSGCGCRTSSPSQSLALLLVLTLTLRKRRRW